MKLRTEAANISADRIEGAIMFGGCVDLNESLDTAENVDDNPCDIILPRSSLAG